MSQAKLFVPWRQLLLPSGRMNRLSFFTYQAVYAGIGLALFALSFAIFFLPSSDLGLLMNSLGFRFGAAACLTGMGWLWFCLHSQRLHDLGLPAVISTPLLMNVPVIALSLILFEPSTTPDWLREAKDLITVICRDVAIGMGAYLLLAPGERGDNRYGSDPLLAPLPESSARLAAEAYLRQLTERNGDTYVITNVESLAKGWVFFWNSETYVKTGEFRFSLAGNNPLFVSNSGNVHVLSTSWEKDLATL